MLTVGASFTGTIVTRAVPTLLALAVFAAVGLAVGHWLGGNVSDHRTVLALATSARHPAVALAIAGANFQQQRAVLAVIFLYLVVGTVVSLPYVMWRKRRHAAAAAEQYLQCAVNVHDLD